MDEAATQHVPSCLVSDVGEGRVELSISDRMAFLGKKNIMVYNICGHLEGFVVSAAKLDTLLESETSVPVNILYLFLILEC